MGCQRRLGKGQEYNLHFENHTVAGRLEKELEVARMEGKGLAGSDCCLPGKKSWWLEQG